LASTPSVEITITPQRQAPQDDSLVRQVNSILDSLEKSREKDYYHTLTRIASLAENSEDTLDPSLREELDEIMYALAYNALLTQGTPPSKIKAVLPKEVWRDIQRDLPDLARALAEKSLADGDYDTARRIKEEYEPYVDDDTKKFLDVVSSRDYWDLLTAVSKNDYDKAAKAIQNLKQQGLYDEAKTVTQELFNIDLDDLAKTVYANEIIGILEESNGPGDALEKIKQTVGEAGIAGMPSLEADLEASREALESASKGDIDGFISAASKIDSSTVLGKDILKYTVSKGLGILYSKYPGKLVSIPDAEADRLQELMSKAGVKGGVKSLSLIREAVETLGQINSLLQKGDAREALETWSKLPEDTKAAAASLAGLTPGEMEETLEAAVRVEELASEADKVASLLGEGRYEEAYREWISLSESDRRGIAKLYNTDYGKLDRYIRLAAGLQAVSQLDNPTLAQVRDTLAEYIGADEAARIARGMLEQTEAYKAKRLADNGDYDEALGEALKIEDKGLRESMVQYILSAVSEKQGAEALAEFIQRHLSQLKPYLPEDMLKNIELISNPADIADNIYQALIDTVSDEYGEKLAGLVKQYTSLLENRDFQGAERLLEENRSILSKAQVNGKPLTVILGGLLDYARAAEELDNLIGDLENSKDDPGRLGQIISEADGIQRRLERLDGMPRDIVASLLEAVKHLKAYAYAYLAQHYLSKGMYNQATRAAERAAELDPEFKQLADTVNMLVLAVRDRRHLEENLECILENILQIKPKPRGGSRKIATRRITYM